MKANPTTLGPSLFALAEACDQHARMLDLHHLLLQLWHHHLSMAKPHTTACSKEYNLELAENLAYHLGYSDKLPPTRAVQRIGRTT